MSVPSFWRNHVFGAYRKPRVNRESERVPHHGSELSKLSVPCLWSEPFGKRVPIERSEPSRKESTGQAEPDIAERAESREGTGKASR